jgi:hypothetical protein
VNIIKGNTVTQCDSAKVRRQETGGALQPLATANMFMKGDHMKAFWRRQRNQHRHQRARDPRSAAIRL